MVGAAPVLIAVPPELLYLPELLGPDPSRAALVHELHARADRWRAEGIDVAVDLGGCGRTAPQTAAEMRGRGTTRAVVAGGERDRVGMAILARALAEQGILVLAVTGDLDTVDRCLRDPAPRPAAITHWPRHGGAAWAVGIGLHDAERRAALRARVRAEAPRLMGPLELAILWNDLGVDPLEEMYAGNHLGERNREMLVNIVP